MLLALIRQLRIESVLACLIDVGAQLFLSITRIRRMIDVKHRCQVLVALNIEGRVFRRLDNVLQVHDCLGDVIEENFASGEIIRGDIITRLVGLHLSECGDCLLKVPVIDVQKALVE